jgi:hypothetical protein
VGRREKNPYDAASRTHSSIPRRRLAAPPKVSVAGCDAPVMNASTLVLGFGAVLFVLPIPGTFVAGGLVLLAGMVARWLGA